METYTKLVLLQMKNWTEFINIYACGITSFYAWRLWFV